MLKTYDDLVENFHKLPIAVAEDIYQRISDWLGSGGKITDKYILRQIAYANRIFKNMESNS